MGEEALPGKDLVLVTGRPFSGVSTYLRQHRGQVVQLWAPGLPAEAARVVSAAAFFATNGDASLRQFARYVTAIFDNDDSVSVVIVDHSETNLASCRAVYAKYAQGKAKVRVLDVETPTTPQDVFCTWLLEWASARGLKVDRRSVRDRTARWEAGSEPPSEAEAGLVPPFQRVCVSLQTPVALERSVLMLPLELVLEMTSRSAIVDEAMGKAIVNFLAVQGERELLVVGSTAALAATGERASSNVLDLLHELMQQLATVTGASVFYATSPSPSSMALTLQLIAWATMKFRVDATASVVVVERRLAAPHVGPWTLGIPSLTVGEFHASASCKPYGGGMGGASGMLKALRVNPAVGTTDGSVFDAERLAGSVTVTSENEDEVLVAETDSPGVPATPEEATTTDEVLPFTVGDVERVIGPTIMKRGRDIFENRIVSIESRNGATITGKAFGSDDNVYHLSMTSGTPASPTATVDFLQAFSCDCPWALGAEPMRLCKHLAGLLLLAIQRYGRSENQNAFVPKSKTSVVRTPTKQDAGEAFAKIDGKRSRPSWMAAKAETSKKAKPASKASPKSATKPAATVTARRRGKGARIRRAGLDLDDGIDEAAVLRSALAGNVSSAPEPPRTVNAALLADATVAEYRRLAQVPSSLAELVAWGTFLVKADPGVLAGLTE